METGLIDLRLALKTMRTTCVALEMHAEMLELEIADLKNIHTPDPASIDQYEDGFRSTMNNLKVSICPCRLIILIYQFLMYVLFDHEVIFRYQQ